MAHEDPLREPSRAGSVRKIRRHSVLFGTQSRDRLAAATKLHQSKRLKSNDLPDVKNGGRSETGIWSDDKKVEAFGCVLTRPCKYEYHNIPPPFQTVSRRQYDSGLISYQTYQHPHHTISQVSQLTPFALPLFDKALTANMSSSTNIRRSSRRAAAKGSRSRNANDSEVRIRVSSSSSPLVVEPVVVLWYRSDGRIAGGDRNWDPIRVAAQVCAVTTLGS
jgi:hypothetical protein